MAEAIGAIGLVASCLSILKAIESINKFARQNLHTNASAKKELSPLLGKLAAYEGLIRGIKLQAELDDADRIRLSVLNHIDGPLKACEIALKAISHRFETLPKHLLLGKIVDKKTSLALKALDASKPILELSLDADQRTITKSIEAYVRNIHEDLQILRINEEEALSNLNSLKGDVAEIRAITAADQEERRKAEDQRSLEEVLTWISTVDPSSNFRAAQRCLQDGDSSGSWFLRGSTFDQWVFGQQPKLWLCGASGSGKTVLTSRIIDVLGRSLAQTSNQVPILYFFFDFNDPSKQKVEGLLRSLILQLAAQCESTVTFLQALYSEHQAQPNKMASAVRKWTDILLKLLGKQDACYIIIDALDECVTLDELIEEIGSLLESAKPSVRWLFVSQPVVEISRVFKEYSVAKVKIRSSAIDEDIRLYVRRRLRTDTRLKSFPPSMKVKITEVMDKKSSGMFRWAQCQLDVLSKLKDRRSVTVERALERLPSDLHVTYKRLLAAIPDDDRALVLRILNFVALCARPVTLDEVAEYAIVEDGMVRVTSGNRFANCSEILQLCGSFVSVQDKILSLAHKSVKDFLLSADVTQRPANEYDDLEIEIGRTCLIYLSFSGDSDNFETCAPSTERLQRLRICYPFLEYAAAMWPHHLRRASHQNALKGLMQSSLNLRGSSNLWKTWLILQPADIWDNQIQLACFLCDAVIRSPDVPGWALDFWDIRQTLRKKDLSKSPNSQNSVERSPWSRSKSARFGYRHEEPFSKQFFLEVSGKQEYTLAVILLEVALQKSLESIVQQEASLGSTYDTLDRHLQLLHDKSEKARSRMGQKYGDVVLDCIKSATLGTESLPEVAASLSPDLRQHILWEKCCQPLQKIARAGFARVHGFRVSPPTEPDCEENNIFGFFTGGTTTHEIGAKDEGSESTLQNFAALLNGEVPVEPHTYLHNKASDLIRATRPTHLTRGLPPSADGVFYGAFSSSFFGRAGLSRVLGPWNYQQKSA